MISGTYDSFVSTYSPYYFWKFEVDGQAANTGIDNTVIMDGAVITFTYKLYDAQAHAQTNLEVKYKSKKA